MRRAPSAWRRSSGRRASIPTWDSSMRPVDKGSLMFLQREQTAPSSRRASPRRRHCPPSSPAGTATPRTGQHDPLFHSTTRLFGYQRIGDLIWAAGDMQARISCWGDGRANDPGRQGTSIRNGQQSCPRSAPPQSARLMIRPTPMSWAVIHPRRPRADVRAAGELFYYLTVMNESYAQPAMPAGAEPGIRAALQVPGLRIEPAPRPKPRRI